jgi:hypothetical protein
VGPAIAEQASNLADQLPALMNDPHIEERLPLPNWLAPYRAHIVAFVRAQFEAGTAYAVPMARQVGKGIVSVASNLVFVLLIPILAFLFIKDGAALRDGFLRWLGAGRYATMWAVVVGDLDLLVGRISGALPGARHFGRIFACLRIAGVRGGCPEALPGHWSSCRRRLACPCDLYRSAGVWLLALRCSSGSLSLSPLRFHDPNPYLMSDGVQVSPLLVLFGLLAGEELAGVAGIFLSVPVIAAAKIVVLRITQARKLETKQYQGSAASSPVERPLIAPAERDKDVPPHA